MTLLIEGLACQWEFVGMEKAGDFDSEYWCRSPAVVLEFYEGQSYSATAFQLYGVVEKMAVREVVC